jgi:hypothetical protein
MSVRLAGINDSKVCDLELRKRALETRGCGFLYSCALQPTDDCHTHGGVEAPSHGQVGSRAIGHVAAAEPSPAGR